jgi:hypothetical protein
VTRELSHLLNGSDICQQQTVRYTRIPIRGLRDRADIKRALIAGRGTCHEENGPEDRGDFRAERFLH